MASYSLPEFVAFQSKYNNKYLQFVHQDGSDVHGYLQFSEESVVSPYTKFRVEVSESDNNLVHLRSCYNNKYWTASPQNDDYIVADSSISEEKQRYRPTFLDAQTVRFTHAILGKFVTLMDQPGQDKDACLHPQSSEPSEDLTDVFSVIDWRSLLILPRNVAFKGGLEGKYLSARPVNNVLRYLQFVADDVSDPTVGHEIFTTTNGNISLKSDFYDKFWRRSTSSWVFGDTSENDVGSNDTLFSPTRIQENVIALKSLGNNDYCKSISDNDATTEEPIIALSAADATITNLSHLEVVDRVVSRSVKVDSSDVRVEDARIPEYGKIVVISSGEATNTENKTVVTHIKLAYYKKSDERTWNSTINGSLKVGQKVDIDSPVPEKNMDLTSHMTGEIVWGKEDVIGQDLIEENYQVTLPPMYKATVQVNGGRMFWDVPFSYTQTNILADGTKTSFKMDDGIYSGSQTFFVGTYNVDLTPII